MIYIQALALKKLEFFNLLIYFDIFFIDFILKNDKNSNLIIKNSNLYRIELNIILPIYPYTKTFNDIKIELQS